jgi:hypothetical protein
VTGAIKLRGLNLPPFEPAQRAERAGIGECSPFTVACTSWSSPATFSACTHDTAFGERKPSPGSRQARSARRRHGAGNQPPYKPFDPRPLARDLRLEAARAKAARTSRLGSQTAIGIDQLPVRQD